PHAHSSARTDAMRCDGPYGQCFGLFSGLDQHFLEQSHRVLLVRVGLLSLVVVRPCAPHEGQIVASYAWTLACALLPVRVMACPQLGQAFSSVDHMPRWGSRFA